MTTRLYQSTDVDAPALTREFGSLIALLDKCLVTGYGSGGDAKAPAGWTKPYAGANQAAFRMGSGSQRYLQVFDDQTAEASGQWARCWGFESMTALDTGVDKWPVVSSAANGVYWRKGNTAAPYAHPWWLVASESWLYLIVQQAQTPTTYVYMPWMMFFGDGEAYNSGDSYLTLLSGSFAPASSQTNYPFGNQRFNPPTSHSSLLLEAVRSHDGSTLNRNCGLSVSSGSDLSKTTYESTDKDVVTVCAAGRLVTAPAMITDYQFGLRGAMPGLLGAVTIDYGRPTGDIITFPGDPRSWLVATLQAISSSDFRTQWHIDVTGAV